jgi:elongation factor P hydroxylase
VSGESLEALFAACFLQEFRTRLLGGADEPLYQPATSSEQLASIYYREDFVASALHEVAHWCIAGPQRRLQVDYGYWYIPDGRDADQQARFEQVEARPQALEWHFALACNWRFQVSNDNLAGTLADGSTFPDAVHRHARHYCHTGLPPRAARFCSALAHQFSGRDRARPDDFDRAGI